MDLNRIGQVLSSDCWTRVVMLTIDGKDFDALLQSTSKNQSTNTTKTIDSYFHIRHGWESWVSDKKWNLSEEEQLDKFHKRVYSVPHLCTMTKKNETLTYLSCHESAWVHIWTKVNFCGGGDRVYLTFGVFVTFPTAAMNTLSTIWRHILIDIASE